MAKLRQRWVALDSQPSNRKEWDLPYFGVIDGDRFLIRGGPTYFTLHRGKFQILKRYGSCPDGSKKEREFSHRFHLDFPPRSGLDLVVELRAGWLSPDGIFYGCYYSDHRPLATRLVYTLDLRPTGWLDMISRGEELERAESEHRDPEPSAPDDYLLFRNWVKVGSTYLEYRVADLVTQSQIDSLFDLIRAVAGKWPSEPRYESVQYWYKVLLEKREQ